VNKNRSSDSRRRSAALKAGTMTGVGSGYGSHFCAVHGFRYCGQSGLESVQTIHENCTLK
jgi:hypothetical protein